MNLRVRPATGVDLDALAALDRACFETPWSLAQWRTELSSRRSYVEVVEGRLGIVGLSCAWIVGDECEVHRIAVAAGQRQRGLGRDLLSSLLERARIAGCRTVFLDVAADNLPARRLYERAGFEAYGRRPGYYRAPPADAVLLRMNLPST